MYISPHCSVLTVIFDVAPTILLLIVGDGFILLMEIVE